LLEEGKTPRFPLLLLADEGWPISELGRLVITLLQRCRATSLPNNIAAEPDFFEIFANG
jgi:hypothetical protein